MQGIMDWSGSEGALPPISPSDLDRTIQMLDQLERWFANFGNYTRALDCARLADGLREYRVDITAAA
jgi:hypothetical protein